MCLLRAVSSNKLAEPTVKYTKKRGGNSFNTEANPLLFNNSKLPVCNKDTASGEAEKLGG